MYPAAFDYHRPSSVEDAVRLLQQNPEAKILGGGHSLLPLMKLRLATPSALIDVTRIPGLSGVRAEGDRIVVGATTTYDDLMKSSDLQQALPLIVEACNVIGDTQVRNKGTIGGSLAHNDPAGDMPAVALALDAEITAVGPGGKRTIAARDFFVDMLQTALNPDEVVTEISFGRPQGRVGMAYEKFAHPASGYAIVGVAAVVQLGEDNRAQSVKVAVTGAGPVARRLDAVESALQGQELTPAPNKHAAP
ncbi:MAG: xanthine dehydrogenase family protein subunit M, partial [Thermomicrobiaceae bacterium]|nr:xanthine dehydrogenase family protein subunit M [Thermomicrobiaceae bacterium]